MTLAEENRCSTCGRRAYWVDMTQRCEGCDVIVRNCDCGLAIGDMQGIRQIPMFGVNEQVLIQPGAFEEGKEVPVVFDSPIMKIPIGKAKIVDGQILMILNDEIDPRVRDIIYGSPPELSKWSIAPERRFIKEELHEINMRPAMATPPIPLTPELKEKLSKLLKGFKKEKDDNPNRGD